MGATSSDTYVRQPSLDTAQTHAMAGHASCDDRIAEWIRRYQPRGKYDGVAFLGRASFTQITRCVIYSADISGGFLKDLEIDEKAKPIQFRKKGKLVSTYPSDVQVEVEPLDIESCSTEPWVSTGTSAPEPVRNLRFMVRWLGASARDLGEVQAEFLHEPWRELGSPVSFYRMRIPSEDIPLTDELEIVIFSEQGQQLACLKGHI